MDFAAVLEHHILDHTFFTLSLGGFQIPFTKHVLMMWIAASIMIVFFTIAARKKSDSPTGFRNLLEIFVLFIRDEIVKPNLGEHGRPYLPYFLTLFFFILLCNLMGLVPYGATATGNISVTAGLAICTFGLINVAGVREQGFGHYVKSFIPPGLPWWLIPIMLPIEVMGLFTKSFALCIRLFANMLAGHIVILSFLGMIFVLGSLLIAPFPVGIALGISLLEIFVAFLQAYIFTFLTAVFCGAAVHPH